MKVNSSLTDSLLRSTRGTSLASDCLTPECQDRWWLWWWWWADLKSVCAFFFIFFSPVLFLFICFSPAWEAAPSPPPQYQALLRQVASTIIDSINDIPCPFLVFDHYDHFDHSSQFCWLRMLTNLGSRPQAHVSQRGWWRSSQMIEEMDQRVVTTVDHRVVTTGKRPFTTTEATAPTTTLSTSHVAGESHLFAILFFWKDAKLRVWYSIVVTSYFMNRIPIESN